MLRIARSSFGLDDPLGFARSPDFLPSSLGNFLPDETLEGPGLFGEGGLFGKKSKEEQAVLDAPDEFFAGNTPGEIATSRKNALEAVRARQAKERQAIATEGSPIGVSSSPVPAAGGIPAGEGLLGPLPFEPPPGFVHGLLSPTPGVIEPERPGFLERVTRAARPNTLVGVLGRIAFGPTEMERLENEDRRARLTSRRAVQDLIGSVTADSNLSPAQGAFLRTSAHFDPAAAMQAVGGLLGFGERKSARALEGKFQAIERRLGQPLTEQQILQIGGAGPPRNENMDVVIPVPQLANIRLPDGSTPGIGTTFREARDAGAQVQTGKEQERVTQADAALGILDELESLAVGEDGIFTNIQPDFISRVGAAYDFALDVFLTQDDPRVPLFKDLSGGTIGGFIRMLGEKGALSDGDVKRAEGLLPKLFPLPDTGAVATQKLRQLRQIIRRGVGNLTAQSSRPVEDIPGFDEMSLAKQERLRQLRQEMPDAQ